MYEDFVSCQGGIALDVNTFVSVQTRKEIKQHNLQYQPGPTDTSA